MIFRQGLLHQPESSTAWDEWRHFLLEHPAGGGFLGLPGLHQLSGQLAKLIGILGCFEGTIELLDLEVLLGGEFDASVHADLHAGVHATYRDEPNVLLQITRLCRFFSASSLNGQSAGVSV